MAKIEVSQVAEILKKHKIEPSLLREIVQEMNEVTAPAADEDLKPPAPKKQFVVLLSDPAGKLPRKDLTGWVVQIPENASPYSTTDRVFKGAYENGYHLRNFPEALGGAALGPIVAGYMFQADLGLDAVALVMALGSLAAAATLAGLRGTGQRSAV